MKMKIVFVSREYPPSRRMGGIAVYISETARFLRARGHEVIVVSASDDIYKFDIEDDHGVRVYRLPGGDFYISTSPSLVSRVRSHLRRLFRYVSYRKRIAEFLSELEESEGFDLVEFADYGGEAFWWSRKQATKPWVVRLHTPTLLDRDAGAPYRFGDNPINYMLGRLEMRILASAHAISSPTRALAGLVASWSNVEREAMYIIPNSINCSNWTPIPSIRSTERAAMGKSEQQGKQFEEKVYRLFSAGTIVHSKGYGELTAAVELLRQQGMAVELTLAGKEGALARALQRQIARRNMGWLKILGLVSRADLVASYRAADLVVFPARWDNFPVVCIEAMASGALILSSNRGGLGEIIQDKVDGFTLDNLTPEALAEAIKNILTMKEEEKNAIRQRALENSRGYDNELIVARLEKFYITLIEGFRKRGKRRIIGKEEVTANEDMERNMG